jgi:hypothetical protein
MSGDGTVEIRITGVVDSSLSAAASQANATIGSLGTQTQVTAKAMSDALKATGGDLSKITPELLGVGAAATSAGSAAASAGAAAASAGAAASGGFNAAAGAASIFENATVRARTEVVVLAHELIQGRFSRIPGSLMVMGEAMGGVSLATWATIGAVAALVGGTGYLIYETVEAGVEAKKLADGFALTGRAAGESAEEVKTEVDALSAIPGVSRAAATEFEHYAAAHASIDPLIANEVGQLLPKFIEMFGKQGPDAAGKLADTLSNLTEQGFQRLDHEMLNLPPAQYEIIENLIRTGQEAEAVNRIMAALSDNAGVYVKTLGDKVYDLEQQIAAARKLFSGDKGDEAAYLAPLLDQLRELHAEQARGTQQSSDNQYKRDLDWSDQVNDSLRERKGIQDSINRALQDEKKAQQRGDTTGAASFAQTAADEQKRLADFDKRQNDETLHDFIAHEDAKVASAKAGSSERIAAVQRELDEAKRLFGENSKEYDDLLKKLGGDKRASAAEGVRAAKEESEASLRKLQETADATRQGSQERINADQKWFDAASKLFGQYSSEGKAAFAALEAAQKAQADQLVATAARSEKAAINAAKDAYEQRATLLDREVIYQQITESQKLAAVKDAAQQETDAEIQAAETELKALEAVRNLEPQKYQEVSDQIVELKRQQAIKLGQIDNQIAQQAVASWQRIIGPIESNSGSMVSSLIQGQQKFGAATRQLLLSIVSEWVTARIKIEFDYLAGQAAMALGGQAWTEKSVLAWVFGESQKTAATVAGVTARQTAEATGKAAGMAADAAAGSSQIMNDAYQAAAGAYKAVVGIPVIGPFLAPIAAGVAFGAVAAFDTLTSAEGGQDRVFGAEQLTMLHRDEMVLPAHIANPLRVMIRDVPLSLGSASLPTSSISAGSSSANPARDYVMRGLGGSASEGSTSNARSGDIHIHATDAQSFKTFLRSAANRRTMADLSRENARAGVRVT